MYPGLCMDVQVSLRCHAFHISYLVELASTGGYVPKNDLYMDVGWDSVWR